MRKIILTAGLLALSACASCPAPRAPTTPPALATEVYALSGQVASLLQEGKLSSAQALALNGDLQVAEDDLRAGKNADAQRLIDSIKGRLP